MAVGVISATDIVGAVLSLLQAEHNKSELPTDREKLHSIFFQLREQNAGLLDVLTFDKRDVTPYSPVLEEAVSNLQMTNDLRRFNPEMKKFLIQPSAQSYKSKFNPEQIASLNQLAAQLANMV